MGGFDPNAWGENETTNGDSTNADLDCSPQNEYVSAKTVASIDDVLAPGEKVHFLSKKGSVEIDSGDEATDLKPLAGVAATDRRIVCKLVKMIGSADISIPYDSITTIDLRIGWRKKKLVVDASDVYEINVSHLSEGECQQLSRFVQHKMADDGSAGGSAATPGTAAASEAPPTDDPIEQLSRLRDLKADGVITEREFDEKKSELMDRI